MRGGTIRFLSRMMVELIGVELNVVGVEQDLVKRVQ